MSHSYSSNRVHVVFSTKGRAQIISANLQPKLWAYMAGIAKNQGFDAIIIGRVPRPCACAFSPAARYAIGESDPVSEGKLIEMDERER